MGRQRLGSLQLEEVSTPRPCRLPFLVKVVNVKEVGGGGLLAPLFSVTLSLKGVKEKTEQQLIRSSSCPEEAMGRATADSQGINNLGVNTSVAVSH